MITEKTIDELIINLHNGINALEEAGESTKDVTVTLPWMDYDKVLCDLKLWFAKVERLKEAIMNYSGFILCANGQKGIHIDIVIKMIDCFFAEIPLDIPKGQADVKEIENDNQSK